MGLFIGRCRVDLVCLAWGTLVLSACTSDQDTVKTEAAKTLMEASTEVIFASAEALGPHRLRTVLTVTEYHNGAQSSEHQEIQIIDWVDWDNWHVERSVDNETVEDVWIVNGQTFEKRSGSILAKRDGEPYRVQLRNTWNQWESTMRPFNAVVSWEKQQQETLFDRKSQVYQGQRDPNKVQSASLKVKNFTSTIWVDENTAVRLLGQMEGLLQNGTYEKQVDLKLERLDINSEVVSERIQELGAIAN